MEIFIDFSAFTENPIQAAWFFVSRYGWIALALFFIFGLLKNWQNKLREQYRRSRRYILLAIDVPKNNLQSPRAVENIFAHLAGAHKGLGFLDNWWFGEMKNSFSLEIVSIGGYIQFIIHTMDIYRDLIEAVIYAQYPDAEITEIEDYTERYKDVKFPSDQYDLFGMEIGLVKDDVYPILTYESFKDETAEEDAFKDPIASMLEGMSRIGSDEEIWLQYVITPADNDWGDKASGTIKKLIGESVERKKDLVDKAFEGFNSILDTIITPPEGGSAKSGKDSPNKLPYLTGSEKDRVTAIQRKISKIGFHTKIRLVYIGKKGSLVKPRVAQGVVGSLKQFNSNNLNGLKPAKGTATGGVVWFKDSRLNSRKNSLLSGYRDRGDSMVPGSYGFILNAEELATLWHFPVSTVKTPSVRKTETKKVEPPISLPTGDINPIMPKKSDDAKPITPPTNLPTG